LTTFRATTDIRLSTCKTHGCAHAHDIRHRLPTDCRLGLKQRPNETAHAFGQRVDLLTMKLIQWSMVKGEEHSTGYKGAIQQMIKKQALINFQIGLRDELKIPTRSQRYTTFQER